MGFSLHFAGGKISCKKVCFSHSDFPTSYSHVISEQPLVPELICFVFQPFIVAELKTEIYLQKGHAVRQRC